MWGAELCCDWVEGVKRLRVSKLVNPVLHRKGVKINNKSCHSSASLREQAASGSVARSAGIKVVQPSSQQLPVSWCSDRLTAADLFLPVSLPQTL